MADSRGETRWFMSKRQAWLCPFYRVDTGDANASASACPSEVRNGIPTSVPSDGAISAGDALVSNRPFFTPAPYRISGTRWSYEYSVPCVVALVDRIQFSLGTTIRSPLRPG